MLKSLEGRLTTEDVRSVNVITLVVTCRPSARCEVVSKMSVDGLRNTAATANELLNC